MGSHRPQEPRRQRLAPLPAPGSPRRPSALGRRSTRRLAAGLLLCLAVLRPALGQQPPPTAEPSHESGVWAVLRLDELPYTDPPAPVSDGLPRADPRQLWTLASTAALMLPPELAPRVLIDGPGEALVLIPADVTSQGWPRGTVRLPRHDRHYAARELLSAQLALHLPAARELHGRLLLPTSEASGLLAVDFVLPTESFGSEDRTAFWRVTAEDATRHLALGHSGTAWWRHLRDAARAAAGQGPAVEPASKRADDAGFYTLRGALELLSGSRAVSENLALDRPLRVAEDDDGAVSLQTIDGPATRPYDWEAALDDADPALDALATIVPADQHALFFPDLQALLRLSDEAQRLGSPLLLWPGQVQSTSADICARYERQLGLTPGDLASLFAAGEPGSVVLTGGDANLASGSDVALLLQLSDPAAGLAAVATRAGSALAGRTDVEKVSGEVEGLPFRGLRSPDRSVSSYWAVVGPALAISNSTVQLAALVRAARGERPALASQPEYRWFRLRYRLGDPDETALLVLSDATIRRWCGPRQRIGSARQTRARGLLAELTARHVAQATAEAGALPPARAALVDIGALPERDGQVSSAVYGNLTFATPVAELDLARVSGTEREAYGAWLSDDEGHRAQVLHPFAARISVGAQTLALDLTVRPRVPDSDDERFLDLCRGSAIAPDAGDPHEDVVMQSVIAVDREVLAEVSGGLLATLAQDVSLFDWLGGSVSVYVDDDPLWDEAAAAADPQAFLDEQFQRMPIALQAEVDDPLELALFLTWLRGFVESTAPGLTTWEDRGYQGVLYVRVGANEEDGAAADGQESLAVYYLSGPEGLTISPSEALIQRVIERRLGLRGAAGAALVEPWIGENLGTRLDGPFLRRALDFWGRRLRDEWRAASWSHLPILNVWHRRFPDEDPVEVQRRLFAATLFCPGGGEYRWNATWQTMESTAFGHPGQPRDDGRPPALLRDLASALFGVTLQEDGLRARCRVRFSAAPDPSAATRTPPGTDGDHR